MVCCCLRKFGMRCRNSVNVISSSCFTPLGFQASRFFESSFDIATNASTIKLTRDTDSFAQGPVILNCSQPVLASLTYGFFSPSGAVMGLATVLSARPVTITTLQVQQDFGRFG